MKRPALAVVILALAAASASAQRKTANSAKPALNAITEADLRRDMFALAGDAMRGREAGTVDELRASMWVADRAREAGLKPAGEDGTYFQWWNLRRTHVSESSSVTIGARPIALWSEAVVWSPIDATIDLPLIWVGAASGAELAAMDLKGKAVAAFIVAPNSPPAATVGLRDSRYTGAAVTQRAAALRQQGAAAVVLVSGEPIETERAFGFVSSARMRGTYAVDSGGGVTGATATPSAALGNAPVAAGAPIPIIWLSRPLLPVVQAPDGRLVATLRVDSYTYPSVNVVAKVEGADPARRNEYVLFSGHQDHDGVRDVQAGDSIRNGADDNASTSVALLAIGRAVARQPLARSTLFVWHGAEERGLLGSRWHAAHPVVPRASIVAVLNADMIGNNHPDTAGLLGVQPPHLNSRALVAAAYQANGMIGGRAFVVDTSWDNPSHPEGWYFRSDHLPYARAGIPALYFSTLPHPLYHTPRDAPETINIPKLARVARWMYVTGWIVGNAAERPDLVPGFRLER